MLLYGTVLNHVQFSTLYAILEKLHHILNHGFGIILGQPSFERYTPASSLCTVCRAYHSSCAVGNARRVLMTTRLLRVFCAVSAFSEDQNFVRDRPLEPQSRAGSLAFDSRSRVRGFGRGACGDHVRFEEEQSFSLLVLSLRQHRGMGTQHNLGNHIRRVPTGRRA